MTCGRTPPGWRGRGYMRASSCPLLPSGRHCRMSSAPDRAHPVTHMRTEIMEQPVALRATIDALLPRAAEAGKLAQGTRQVLFIARGTSDNAAVYGSYLIQAYAGRLATLASPSFATMYRSRLDLSGVLAVALSQSGRTDVLVAALCRSWACCERSRYTTNRQESHITAGS